MYNMKLTPFELTMLSGWELVHNKGQLTLWIMVAIRQKKEFAEDILVFIKESADLDPEGQSLYRSLRRLEKSTLVQSQKVASPGGPDKKRFTLTAAGKNVLDAFIERDINRIIIQGYKDGLFDLER